MGDLMKSKLLFMLLAIAAAVGIAAAPAAAEPLAALCSTFGGNLCLTESNGVVVVVPGGQGARFSPALPVVDIVNGTTIGYCIGATPVVGSIGAHQERKVSLSVFSVTPAPPGTFCPL